MRIWAVGGGKGGTGKSLIAHGLACALAERGLGVTLVDADFGGPNQHTYCGMRHPAASLAQFFEDRVPLAELAQATSVPNLALIPGNLNTARADNITFAQKQKLFRQIRGLGGDHVLLDLGAGSQIDTLDTFLMAEHQVAVIGPEPLSIENFYLFLKNLQYRQVAKVLSKLGLKDSAMEVWRHRRDYGIATTPQFVVYLRGMSAAFSEELTLEQGRLRVNLVLNQVREFRQVETGQAVASAINTFFHARGSLVGYVRHDKDLWQRAGSFNLRSELERILDAILKQE